MLRHEGDFDVLRVGLGVRGTMAKGDAPRRFECGDLPPKEARAVVVLLVDQSTDARLEHDLPNALAADRVAVARPPLPEVAREPLEGDVWAP